MKLLEYRTNLFLLAIIIACMKCVLCIYPEKDILTGENKPVLLIF